MMAPLDLDKFYLTTKNTLILLIDTNNDIVKLQTQSEGLGVDFTFAMEQEEQQEQASPKFLGWDGTRGLKFGNLT